LSDALASTYSPERTQQAQMMAQFLGAPAISRTLDKLSYGEPLTTGAGGLGGTTRFNNDALEAAMTIAPMVGPAAKVAGKGAMATGRFVAPKAGQLAEQYMVKTGGILPLDVYHGTPHTLPPTARNPLGEFDASKIGTGEGAQVYGHGIYTAENPVVAKGYQEALSNPEVVLKDGTRISKPKTGSPEDVAKAWLEEAYLNGDKTPFDTAIQKVSRLRNSANSPKQFDGALNVLNEWKKSGASVDLGGNLYKIDLPDEKIAKMLDYDRPLSQQPEILKSLTPEAMGLKLRVAPQSGFMGYVTENGTPIGLQVKGATAENFRKKWLDRIAEFGEAEGGAGRVIGYLGGTSETSAAQVAEALRKAGIPGIKYLDEGSRNLANTWIVKHPQGGENVFSTKESAEAFLRKYPEDKSKLIEPKVTRNFVTFPGEEKSMTILERNGQKFDNSSLTGSKFVYPQDEALRLAQQRASLPPAQGGLGVEYNNSSVLINPKNIQPLNKIEDVEKYKNILNSMEEFGYQGRPILAYMDKGKAKALTGSHRLYAARNAGIEVPVVFVKPSVMKWEDKEGLFGTFKESIGDQRVYQHLKAAGDDTAASLAKLEDTVLSSAAPDLLAGQSPQQAPKFDNSALMK
jgi:hypothetical protein